MYTTLDSYLEIKTAKSYSSSSDPQILEMEIYGVVKSPVKTSKMEISDLYQKRSESINEKNGIICELKQM